MVEGKVVVELKSLDRLNDIHTRWVPIYARLGGAKLGYPLNLGTVRPRYGLARFVNGLRNQPRRHRLRVFRESPFHVLGEKRLPAGYP